MRTERQIEASRANGAKSRGPVTPEGKRNSCGNALKHGLLADTIVLKGELEERFLELLADFERELQPETTMEYLLVQKMAAAQWRQFRLWGMEKAAMEYQIRKQAGTVGRGEDNATRASLAFQTLSDDSRSLDLLHRYDSLCDRQYLRAHKRFLELRRHRGASPPPAPSNLKPEVPPAPEASAPRDLDTQPVWEPFVPEPSSSGEAATGEPANEKQPNEPGNLLETLEPAAPNPTPKPHPRNPDPPQEGPSAPETGSNSVSIPIPSPLTQGHIEMTASSTNGRTIEIEPSAMTRVINPAKRLSPKFHGAARTHDPGYRRRLGRQRCLRQGNIRVLATSKTIPTALCNRKDAIIWKSGADSRVLASGPG